MKTVCDLEYKLDLLKRSFRTTIPVMTGYIFLGFAFGVLLTSKGIAAGWAVFMSIFIYAGSMQFLAVDLLTSVFAPMYSFLLTLVIQARHLFYGISMLERFKDVGKFRPYMIFGLTDETFSILCSIDLPEDINEKRWLMFCITILDQIYWICGTVLGAVIGGIVKFNSSGIEFVMTALFVVIVINQWLSQSNHAPVLIGIGASVACLLIFGASGFVIPSMLSIVVLLCTFKKPIERRLP